MTLEIGILDVQAFASAGQSRQLRQPSGNKNVMSNNNHEFSAIVMPYMSDALSLARWLARNRVDAEDIVQEACLRAFRSLASYSGGNPKAWLLAIVRNTAYSWLERNRQTLVIGIDDLNASDWMLVEGGHADRDTPETELIAKAQVVELRDAIERLPLEYRETLILRDVNGLEYREIAKVIDAPIGTVMSRLSRARRLLINSLHEQ